MTLRRTPLGYDALRVYARVLRDHRRSIANWCVKCDGRVNWPCPDWIRASEALHD